jgi:hypothetical protein
MVRQQQQQLQLCQQQKHDMHATAVQHRDPYVSPHQQQQPHRVLAAAAVVQTAVAATTRGLQSAW